MRPLLLAALLAVVPDGPGDCEIPTGEVSYVYNLQAPRIDATGYDGAFLRESVPVMLCESRGRAGADTNPPYVGLFQVERGSYDPAENLDQAYHYWLRRGWQPWPVCGRLVR